MNLLKTIRRDTKLMVLTVLLSGFILFDIRPPVAIAGHINSLLGRIVIILVVITLLFSNPIVGALSIFAAYELFRRSELTHSRQYIPSENKKAKQLASINQFPKTLEEEVVQSMIPTASPKKFPTPSFRPSLESAHQAVNLK